MLLLPKLGHKTNAMDCLFFISLSIPIVFVVFMCKVGKHLLQYTLCSFSVYIFSNHESHKGGRGYCWPVQ